MTAGVSHKVNNYWMQIYRYLSKQFTADFRPEIPQSKFTGWPGVQSDLNRRLDSPTGRHGVPGQKAVPALIELCQAHGTAESIK